MNDRLAICAKGLRAGYGRREVLHELTFDIPIGQWYVLLGPNGSGKTTLMKTLMGMILPSGGEASILGLPCFEERREVKRQVGYVSEESFLYRQLNAVQHLRFAGDMHCVSPNDLKERTVRLLEFFDLQEVARKKLQEFSLGMKRKVELSMALIHNPRVLILDEPFNGLDPLTTQTCRRFLRDFCDQEQRTILMSTHNLGMMHDYCDQMLVISEGTILAQAPPAHFCAQYPTLSFEEIFLKLVGEPGEDRHLLLTQQPSSGDEPC